MQLLPSIRSMERILRAAGMVKPCQKASRAGIDYPHLPLERPGVLN